MKRRLEDVRNEWIDHLGEKSERFGFPRVAGQLEGLLFLTAGPLSLDEMAARLEVSKAAVSNNIRLLERWKVVRKVYHRGERKNFYEIAGDIWEIETEVVKTLAQEELERVERLVERSEKVLAGVDPGAEEAGEAGLIRRRLEEMKEYLEAAEHLLGLLMKQGKITAGVVKKIQIS